MSTGGSPAKEGLAFGLLISVIMISVAVVAKAAKQQVSSLPIRLVFENLYDVL